MTRRHFLHCAAAGLAAPLILLLAQPSADEKRRRIGINTILFRMRFPATRVEGHPILPALTLADVPAFYADRFRIHNVELWSRHFEAITPAYLKDLKKAIARSQSRLINIQLDSQPYKEGNIEGYFLGSKDDTMRLNSQRFVKQWIDAAAQLGAEAVRINTERGDFNTCVESFREITAYAAAREVLVLVENHGGFSADPDLHVRLIREVNHRNIRTSPDFGNHRPEIRYEALRKIMPFAAEVEPKALPFNEKFEHVEYDFPRCMRIAAESGFSGVYSVDYWDKSNRPADYEKIADWLIENTMEYM